MAATDILDDEADYYGTANYDSPDADYLRSIEIPQEILAQEQPSVYDRRELRNDLAIPGYVRSPQAGAQYWQDEYGGAPSPDELLRATVMPTTVDLNKTFAPFTKAVPTPEELEALAIDYNPLLSNEERQAAILSRAPPDPFFQSTSGRLEGVAQIGESLATPMNVAIMASTLGLGDAPILGRILSGAFAGDMGSHIGELAREYGAAVESGDPRRIARAQTALVGTGIFTVAAAKHAAEPRFTPPAGVEVTGPRQQIDLPISEGARRLLEEQPTTLPPSQIPEGNVPSIESVPNRPSGNAEFLSNILNGNAFRDKGLSGLDAPSQREVMASVFSSLHDPQILESVIKTVPIDVVNKFISAKNPSEVSLHDPSVFSHLATIDRNDSVSLRIDVAEDLARATAAAIGEKANAQRVINQPQQSSQKETQHALSQRSAEEVFRNVPEESISRAGQVPAEEGGGGVPQRNVPPRDVLRAPSAEEARAGALPLEQFQREEGAKPEIVKQSTSPYKNRQGDPIGTTYRATPEDFARYQEIQAEIGKKVKVGETEGPEIFALFKENEAIKNKYGGMPPEPPARLAPAESGEMAKEPFRKRREDETLMDYARAKREYLGQPKPVPDVGATPEQIRAILKKQRSDLLLAQAAGDAQTIRSLQFKIRKNQGLLDYITGEPPAKFAPAESGKITPGTPLDWKALSAVDKEGYRSIDVEKLRTALDKGEIKGPADADMAALRRLLEPSEKHPIRSIRIIDLAPEDLKAITGKDVAYRGRFTLERESPASTIEVLTRDRNNNPITHADFVQTLTHELTHNAVDSKLDQASPRQKADLKAALDRAALQAKGTPLEGHNAWTSPYEFMAELRSNPRIREFLRNTPMPGTKGSIWGRIMEVFRKIMGWPEKLAGKGTVSVLDEALRIGEELHGIKREAKGAQAELAPTERLSPAEPTPQKEKAFDQQQLGIIHPAFRSALEMVQGIPGALKDSASELAGKSAPRTSNRSVESGNALITYASSKIAAPVVAKSMATDVLGTHHNDLAFGQKLGAVLVEDRLRAIKDARTRAGDPGAANVNTIIGKQGGPFKTEAEFQAALADPEIQAAIARHKATVQPAARSAHTAAGGELAGNGLNTGAFVNLKPVFEGGESALLTGGGRGNLQNPLRRPSRFSRRATGEAENYHMDYRTIAERMIKGNFEEVTKRRMYAQLVRDGLAVIANPSDPRPEFGGKPGVKFQIERKGVPSGEGKARTYVKNIWVDPSVAAEVRQALDVDGRVEKMGLVQVANLINRIQLRGPTDAVWHVANGLGSIAGSQGGRNMLVDLARKLPGVNIADSVVRTVASGIKVLAKSPEVQRQLAQLANIGALRGEAPGGGVLLLIDRSMRLVRDNLYQNLVRRGVVTDTPARRREWVNQMGQYNPRLMGQFQRFFKEAGFSPFIVAGRNFNRMAARRLTLSPGIEAASPAAAAQMRAVEFFGTAATAIAIPALFNQLLTGSPSGRPGVKMGQIDTGKDDKDGKHIVIDPSQWTGLRRGLRISGLQATIEGLRAGDTGKHIGKQAIEDILGGMIHPWAGPFVTAATIARTGYSPSGYQESENPKDYAKNVKAAGEQLNPLLKGVFKAWEQPQAAGLGPKVAAGVKGAVSPLAGALGLKSVPAVTPYRQLLGPHSKFLANNPDPKVRADYEAHEAATFPVSQYKDLDKALEVRDRDAVLKAITELQPLVKNDSDIKKRMRPYVGEGFTSHPRGLFHDSHKLETQFRNGLNDQQRALYDKAMDDRQERWRFFLDVWPDRGDRPEAPEPAQ